MIAAHFPTQLLRPAQSFQLVVVVVVVAVVVVVVPAAVMATVVSCVVDVHVLETAVGVGSAVVLFVVAT